MNNHLRDAKDDRPAGLCVADGEEGLFLVALDGRRWRAEDVRALKVVDGPDGPAVCISLFDEGRPRVPAPSKAQARRVLREFAAAVNRRISRRGGRLGAGVRAAFRGARGGPRDE